MTRDNEKENQQMTDLTVSLLLLAQSRGMAKTEFLIALGQCWDAVEKAENEARVFN